MNRRKLEAYYKFVQAMDESMIKLCGVHVDSDTQRLRNRSISVEQFVDMKFFSYMR